MGGFVHLPDDNATRHSGAGERANCVYAAHLLREAVFPQEGGVYGLRAVEDRVLHAHLRPVARFAAAAARLYQAQAMVETKKIERNTPAAKAR